MTKKHITFFIILSFVVGIPFGAYAERLITNPPLITVETAPHSAKPKSVKKKSTVRNLKLGMVGNDVLVLQKFLIKKNVGPAAQALAKSKPNGRFGPATQEALKEFQKSKGLVSDGIAGAKIRTLYNKI